MASVADSTSTFKPGVSHTSWQVPRHVPRHVPCRPQAALALLPPEVAFPAGLSLSLSFSLSLALSLSLTLRHSRYQNHAMAATTVMFSFLTPFCAKRGHGWHVKPKGVTVG
jgi:hypothetical protein